MMERREFIERFTAHMHAAAGDTFPNGEPVAEYAEDVAQFYWEDEDWRRDGPEACADEDMRRWEDPQ